MTVYLVGAGPGDAELLTLRAARLLAIADVVIYDRLVGGDVLDMIAPWAESIAVGKDPYGKSVPQAEINKLLIDKGAIHDCVVRLKGGDPYVFGRGGEESVALGDAGISCEVVPGISSAIAGPAAAGIPVTHRATSSGFTVITGFQSPSNPQRLDWGAVAQLGTTLVILMGAARASIIRESLVAGGAPDSTPVAVITKATTPEQTVLRISLRELGNRPIENPSILVVGPAAALELAEVDGARARPSNHRLLSAIEASPNSPIGDLPWQ